MAELDALRAENAWLRRILDHGHPVWVEDPPVWRPERCVARAQSTGGRCGKLPNRGSVFCRWHQAAPWPADVYLRGGRERDDP